MGRLNHINGGFRGAGSLVSSKDEPEYTGQTMAFAQPSAPLGWVKVSDFDDYTLRIVNGSTSNGGTATVSGTFSTVNPYGPVSGPWAATVGTTTVAVANMAAHTHVSSGSFSSTGGNSGYGPAPYRTAYTAQAQGPTVTASFGAGGGHTHTASLDQLQYDSSTPFQVKYLDVILARY